MSSDWTSILTWRAPVLPCRAVPNPSSELKLMIKNSVRIARSLELNIEAQVWYRSIFRKKFVKLRSRWNVERVNEFGLSLLGSMMGMALAAGAQYNLVGCWLPSPCYFSMFRTKRTKNRPQSTLAKGHPGVQSKVRLCRLYHESGCGPDLFKSAVGMIVRLRNALLTGLMSR